MLFDEIKEEAFSSSTELGLFDVNLVAEKVCSIEDIEEFMMPLIYSDDEGISNFMDWSISALEISKTLLSAIENKEFSRVSWSCPSIDAAKDLFPEIKFPEKKVLFEILEFIREFNIIARERMIHSL